MHLLCKLSANIFGALHTIEQTECKLYIRFTARWRLRLPRWSLRDRPRCRVSAVAARRHHRALSRARLRGGLEIRSVCVECLIGKQKKPILFKVTEPSSIPYRTPPACAKRAAYSDPPPVILLPESGVAQAAYAETLLPGSAPARNVFRYWGSPRACYRIPCCE